MALVHYWCSAPPTTVAEDLDCLKQAEDHPVSPVKEQFFSSAVLMPVVDTEFKVTTLGYVCTGPCKDWLDWPDTLGQPGWCSHCKVPAQGPSLSSRTVTHVASFKRFHRECEF